MGFSSVTGIVVRGHGVASGSGGDPRFPGGSLAMQVPFFAELGLDLSDFHLATINLSIAPATYEIVEPRWTFSDVKWHPTEAAETFSFFECRVDNVPGFIYYPHPETKPEHHQPSDVIEVLLREKLEGVDYGSHLRVETVPEQLVFRT